MKIILVLVLVFLSCNCDSDFEHTIKTLQGLSPKEFRSQVCKSFDKKGGLLRCAPEDPKENMKMAHEYIKSNGRPDPSSLSPVIILPGLAGSAMQAKLKNHVAPHWWCWSNWDEWFRLWLPIQELLAQDCWFDNLQVIYNTTTNEYDSPIGVTVDTMDFGGTGGIDYLDYWFGFPIPFTTYYSSFLASLEAVGYQKGVNLFGAPFDWRVPTSIHELDESRFNQRFFDLIEDVAKKTGKQVHIITHSMGGHVAIEFFNTMNQSWLDKYIGKFIPIAAPWAGSPKVLRTVLSGDNFGIEVLGINLLNVKKVQQLARSGGGLIELLPFAAYYDKNTVFVQQNNKTYTANDFTQLFEDANAPVTASIYQHTRRVRDDIRTPRVESYCVYGDGVPTEVFYNYTNGFESDPVITWSQGGDGTVPIESLKMCSEWATKQSQPVVSKQFDLVGHSDILHDPDVFAYIISLLKS